MICLIYFDGEQQFQTQLVRAVKLFVQPNSLIQFYCLFPAFAMFIFNDDIKDLSTINTRRFINYKFTYEKQHGANAHQQKIVCSHVGILFYK